MARQGLNIAILCFCLQFSFLMQTKGRKLPPEKTVELGIFIDQYLYSHWVTTARSPFSASSIHEFIQSYLDVLLESLNLIYAHPSLRSSSLSEEGVPIIGFHLAHTQLLWRGDAPGSGLHWRQGSSSSAPTYLETFCDFANKENWGGTRWDHALLLTGVNLNFPNGTNYGVAGISWDNSMCNRTYSCSIVEGKTFRSVMTAVHEIGHSLGIEHDGLKYNFKCPPRGYIMSHSGGGDEEEDKSSVGKIAWSPCSSNNLKAFLSTAPNVLSNQLACLSNDPVGGVRSMRGLGGRVGVGGLPPGRRFSVEEQCRMRGGSMWTPSTRRRHLRKMCSSLYCINTRSGELIPLHPALEGTPCGKNKVCKFGECMPDPAVPRSLFPMRESRSPLYFHPPIYNFK